MSDIKYNGGPAFPSEERVYLDGEMIQKLEHRGMSLRDWFAGMALQGLLSRDTVKAPENNNLAKWAVMNPLDAYTQRSAQSYEYADAMLKAREK